MSLYFLYLKKNHQKKHKIKPTSLKDELSFGFWSAGNRTNSQAINALKKRIKKH